MRAEPHRVPVGEALDVAHVHEDLEGGFVQGAVADLGPRQVVDVERRGGVDDAGGAVAVARAQILLRRRHYHANLRRHLRGWTSSYMS